ncbi:hypothetical protein L7F22_031470 [Adiantum nelumboides]|nr:hypothetical protein [Adiantum nelumboides]
MADRPDDVTEEVSSSQGQETHEVGESSRPPQTEDEIFRTQLVAAVSMFTQVMQNPKFMALLQPPPPSQPVETKKQKSEPVKAPTQVIHTAESMETPVHLSETMQSPKPAGKQLTDYATGLPTTIGTVFGGAQTMMPNPTYGSIGMQPGFQSTQGQFGMPQANFGMAGFTNQQPYMASPGKDQPRKIQRRSTFSKRFLKRPRNRTKHGKAKPRPNQQRGQQTNGRNLFLLANRDSKDRQRNAVSWSNTNKGGEYLPTSTVATLCEISLHELP